MSSDHKALAVIAAVAAMGVGVRLTRDPASADAIVGASATTAAARASGGGGGAKRAASSGSADDQKPKKGKRRKQAAPSPSSGTPAAVMAPAPGALDRAGYVGDRLDLDGATLAQIESLPGIGPKLAGRIVLDRAAHGPFLNKEGLHRVKGVGPVLLQRLDSLVTFSGRLTPLPDSAAASLKPDGLTSRSDSTRSRAKSAKKRAKKPGFS